LNKLHLHLPHLDHNYHLIRSQLSPQTSLIGVVKAGAYGSDIIVIAKRLEHLGVDSLAVAYASEGEILREAGIKIPILVFYPQLDGLQKLLEAKLEPTIYSVPLLNELRKLVKNKKYNNYPVHIKYNTGLNRVGFAPKQVSWILDQFQGSLFELKSVYSHLAASETSKDNLLNKKQIECFLSIKEQHQANKKTTPKFHLLNSSGLFNYPEYKMDAVRCGIALHGFANQPHWDSKLMAVSTLESKISQIHQVKKGEHVGYNHAWKAARDSRIATLPIGHADGIGRHFGNQKTVVYIQDKPAPIIGNVCMDMLMIDVTEVSCQEGTIVSLFGKKQNAAHFAEKGGTISYELLSSIGPRVQRVIHY